jgi:hypothetical protein
MTATDTWRIAQGTTGVLKFDCKKQNQILFIKFGKIWYNSTEFWLEDVLYSKNWKQKNRLNLPINQTELVEIQSNSSKIRWNSRDYWSLKK